MAFARFRKVLTFTGVFFSSNTKMTIFPKSQGITSNINLVLWRYSSRNPHIVQMRGLDYETTEQDIIDFFKPLGLTLKKVNLKCDGGGRTASVSEVEFSTHAEAVVAMRKRNAFMGNRFIRLTLKSNEVLQEQNNKNENPVFESTTVGLSIENQTKESCISGVHCLRMKNVPWRITDQVIYEFFWPVGALPISVKPLYNESGLRIGEFDVQFLSQEDMRKAMAKNNSYLGNKFVELSFKDT